MYSLFYKVLYFIFKNALNIKLHDKLFKNSFQIVNYSFSQAIKNSLAIIGYCNYTVIKIIIHVLFVVFKYKTPPSTNILKSII
jgi:hypothetical protein